MDRTPIHMVSRVFLARSLIKTALFSSVCCIHLWTFRSNRSTKQSFQKNSVAIFWTGLEGHWRTEMIPSTQTVNTTKQPSSCQTTLPKLNCQLRNRHVLYTPYFKVMAVHPQRSCIVPLFCIHFEKIDLWLRLASHSTSSPSITTSWTLLITYENFIPLFEF